jgi:hypothetical protein
MQSKTGRLSRGLTQRRRLFHDARCTPSAETRASPNSRGSCSGFGRGSAGLERQPGASLLRSSLQEGLTRRLVRLLLLLLQLVQGKAAARSAAR